MTYETAHGHGSRGNGHGHEENMPETVKKFFEKEKYIDQIIETTSLEHSNVFIEAANKFLRDESGKVDYSKLNEKEVREQVAEFMADLYLKKARALGAPETESEIEKDIILNRYFGVTKDLLKQSLHRSKSRYTLRVHEEIRDKHLDELRKELRPLAGSHIEEEHLEDIIAYVGGEEMLDPELLKSNPAHAGDILRLYRQGKGKLEYTAILQQAKHLLPYVPEAYQTKDIAEPEAKIHHISEGKKGHGGHSRRKAA